MATVTPASPSLPAAHAVGALMARRCHWRGYRAAVVGLAGLSATTSATASAPVISTGCSTWIWMSGCTLCTPLAAPSCAAATSLSPDTTAIPAPACDDTTVP